VRLTANEVFPKGNRRFKSERSAAGKIKVVLEIYSPKAQDYRLERCDSILYWGNRDLSLRVAKSILIRGLEWQHVRKMQIQLNDKKFLISYH